MWSLRTLVDELGLRPEYYGWAWVIAMAVIAIWAFSASGLVFVWAGLSRRHWFMRLAGATGVVAMAWLLPGVRPHRAWDLAAAFLVQGVVVVGALGLVRGTKWAWKAWRRGGWRAWSPMRFGLLDLLLLFIVVGMALAAFRGIPEEYSDFEWPVIVGMAAGAGTLLQTWAALGNRLTWLRVLAALVQFPALVAVCLGSSRRAGLMPGSTSSEQPATTSRPIESDARRTLGAITVAIGAPVIALWLRLAFPPAVELVPVPTPNGYDELLRIGEEISDKQLTPRWFGYLDGEAPSPSAEDWRQFLVKVNETLGKAEAALREESAVPIERLGTNDSLLGLVQTNRDGEIRKLVRLFDWAAAGNTALDDPSNAARWVKNSLRLADRGERGGLWLDYISAGWATRQMAARRAFDLRNRLSAEDARDLARALADAEPREPVERVVRRMLAWEEREQGWMAGLRAVVAGFLPNGHHSARLLRLMHDSGLARQRLASTELAVAAFRAEQGRLPRRLEELVPNDLPSMLHDPFSAGPFVFRSTYNDYLLYSLGEDRDDDDGRQVDLSLRNEPPDGDLFFEHASHHLP